MPNLTNTIRRLSRTPVVPPDPAALPVEVELTTFRTWDATHSSSPTHSRLSSLLMSESGTDDLSSSDEDAPRTPWMRLPAAPRRS